MNNHGGYNGWSMSNRAVAAYEDGKMPASKFAVWAKKWFKGCTAADVRAALPAAEWHHTSKKFNKTYFYDPRDLMLAENRENLRDQIEFRKESEVDWKIAESRGWLTQFGVQIFLKNESGEIEKWYTFEKKRGSFTDFCRLSQQIKNGFAGSNNKEK